jgi:hypothetical protein
MIKNSRVSLWPTAVAFYELEAPELIEQAYAKADQPLEGGLMSATERRVKDFLDPELKAQIQDCVKHYLGPEGAEFLDADYCENRALLIEKGAHISTHCDSREGDVTAVLFLSGSGKGQPINSVGDPRFVLEDPSRYADQARLPFEARPGYSVNPRAGLLVVFPSWIPHNQHPYRGNSLHVQIVANFRLNIPDSFQEEHFD